MSLKVSIEGRDLPGRPLLLCNGIGAGIDQWAAFRGHLNRPTIAFDPPRFARRHPTMGDYARVIEAAVDEAGMGRVDVLGYSWGGMQAMELCIRDSMRRSSRRRIGRAVVAHSLPGYTSIPSFQWRAFRTMMSSDRSTEALAGAGREVYGDDVSVATMRELRIVRDVDSRVYQQQRGALFLAPPLLPRLVAMGQETLVITGTRDPIVHPANGVLLRSALRRSRLHYLDAGHLGLLLQAREVAGVVNQFLGDNDMEEAA